MDLGGGDAVDAAFDALTVGYEHLLKLVEDGGLEGYDNIRFVAYLQGFERFRNRLALADHQAVRDAQRRNLAGELCQSSLPRALAATLRISVGEADRRVRAADALTERMSMTGQPLAPVRPHLAAAQRDGEISRGAGRCGGAGVGEGDRVGFDPDDVAWGEQQLAGWAGTVRTEGSAAAGRAGGGRDRPGRHPARRHSCRPTGGYFTMHSTKDGGYAGEFRLTAEAGVKLQAVLGPLATPRVNSTADRGRSAGRGARYPDLRAADARRPRSRLRPAAPCRQRCRMPVAPRRR